MNLFEIRSIDLKDVPDNEFIKFLRVEIPVRRGYGPARFAIVRYARNGNDQEEKNGMPIDMGKGIFTATLEDEELGDISRETLEADLQKAVPDILRIVREKFDPPTILKSILKDYPYLKYDKHNSKPPHVLKGTVTDPQTPRQIEDLTEIAHRLNEATNANYKALCGNSSSDDNFDTTWTRFSFRITPAPQK